MREIQRFGYRLCLRLPPVEDESGKEKRLTSYAPTVLCFVAAGTFSSTTAFTNWKVSHEGNTRTYTSGR